MSTIRRHRSTPSTTWRPIRRSASLADIRVGLLPLHGDRRPGTALAGAVLLDQLQPRARADGAGLRPPRRALYRRRSASPTRTRRASSSTPPRCSSATSSPATTASKAARAPISASAIPAAYGNGWTTNALFGQSYHLAGENSFAAPDLVNAGAYSGLETDTSDYVGLVGFATPERPVGFGQRPLDEQTLEMRRSRAQGRLHRPTRSRCRRRYAFIQAQPLYGFDEDRSEVTLGASARLHENWRVFGSGTYDFETERAGQRRGRLRL